jgi:hypothetical protein
MQWQWRRRRSNLTKQRYSVEQWHRWRVRSAHSALLLARRAAVVQHGLGCGCARTACVGPAASALGAEHSMRIRSCEAMRLCAGECNIQRTACNIHTYVCAGECVHGAVPAALHRMQVRSLAGGRSLSRHCAVVRAPRTGQRKAAPSATVRVCAPLGRGRWVLLSRHRLSPRRPTASATAGTALARGRHMRTLGQVRALRGRSGSGRKRERA